MEENISNTLHKICDAFMLYGKSKLSNDAAIANMAKEFQKSVKSAKENEVMFSVPCHIDVSKKEKYSIIDCSILVLHHLMKNDANVTEIGKSKLIPLWLEMSALVLKGNNVSKEVWELLQVEIQEEHNNYLSDLKKIVCDSIEEGEKKDVTVKRDNAFYYVKCPEESVITPAKFMNLKEFKNLEYGALQMGEGDNVIRIKNGQYCNMKGKLNNHHL